MKKTFCLLVIAIIVTGLGCGDTENASLKSQEKNTKQDAGTDDGWSNLPMIDLPEEMPADLPILPDSRPIHFGFDTSISALHLGTKQAVEEVIAFYTKELSNQGWKTKNTFPEMIIVEKPDKRFVRVHAYNLKDGKVCVALHYR